jgi:hypothetical protein
MELVYDETRYSVWKHRTTGRYHAIELADSEFLLRMIQSGDSSEQERLITSYIFVTHPARSEVLILDLNCKFDAPAALASHDFTPAIIRLRQ